MEIWKSLKGIVDCGTYYEVSNFGNVRSVDRTTTYSDGRIAKFKGKILKYAVTKDGYKQVHLMEKRKGKTYLVHRLVALVFIPNPNNLQEINHKDECKGNNVVTNLEWCDRIYNCNFGTRNERVVEKSKQPIKVFNAKTNDFIGEFESVREASRQLNINHGGISHVLNGNMKTYKGYKFIRSD